MRLDSPAPSVYPVVVTSANALSAFVLIQFAIP
jgi:hypothetical protein